MTDHLTSDDTAPARIWIWPNRSATGVVAWGAGCYRAEPHRPLDDKGGPTGAEYVSGEAVAALVEALKRAENYISNTESEIGLTLKCGEIARAALAAFMRRDGDAAAQRARQMNAELPQATRDVLAVKGMI